MRVEEDLTKEQKADKRNVFGPRIDQGTLSIPQHTLPLAFSCRCAYLPKSKGVDLRQEEIVLHKLREWPLVVPCNSVSHPLQIPAICRESRRWELNPQPQLYESCALPLSYVGNELSIIQSAPRSVNPLARPNIGHM